MQLDVAGGCSVQYLAHRVDGQARPPVAQPAVFNMVRIEGPPFKKLEEPEGCNRSRAVGVAGGAGRGWRSGGVAILRHFHTKLCYAPPSEMKPQSLTIQDLEIAGA